MVSISEKGLSEILKKKNLSEEESTIAAKALFVLYLDCIYLPYLFSLEIDGASVSQKKSASVRKSLYNKIRHLGSRLPFLKKIYYKFSPPNYVDKPESRYFNDFKVIKDFLESR